MAFRVLTLLLVLPLTACGFFPKEKTKHEAGSPEDHGGDDQAPDGSGGGDATDEGQEPGIEVRQHLVIREPGASEADAAAIFLLQSEQGALVVRDVKGPSFLGAAAVGKLDDETSKKLFAELSSPLPAEKMAELLGGYRNATVIYFKNYKGRLCGGGQYHLEITTDIRGVSPISVFDFKGIRGGDGQCSFQSLALTTSYSDAK